MVVSVLDDPRLNPAETYSLICENFVSEKRKINKKETEVGPFKNFLF